MKTVTELVCEVAEFAKTHRWRKGVRKSTYGTGYAYCMLGYCDAVLAQNGIDPGGRYNPRSRAGKTYLKLITRIASTLSDGFSEYDPSTRAEYAIINFNDAGGRKKREVIAVLERACDAGDEDG